MTKDKSPVLPEEKESAHNINLYITGEPVEIKIGKAVVYLRQPSYLERDQADLQESIFSRHIEVENEEISILSESPAPQDEIDRLKDIIKKREELLGKETDEVRKRVINERLNFMYTVIEGRHAAEAILERFSSRAKMRWYARTLVVNEQMESLNYDAMHPAVQDQIMDAVETMMEDIDTLPLGLA